MRTDARTAHAVAALIAFLAGLTASGSASAQPYLPIYGGPTYTPGVGGYKVSMGTAYYDFPKAGDGVAVGAAEKYDAAGMRHGSVVLRWDASGAAAIELGNIGIDAVGSPFSRVNAANGAGLAVGTAVKYNASGAYVAHSAARWDASGTPAVELGNLGTQSNGYTQVTPYAINATGTAVGEASRYRPDGSELGWRAVRWDATSTVAVELDHLGTNLVGYTRTRATAINATGAAVGLANRYGPLGSDLGETAVRWDTSGAVTELQRLWTTPTGVSYTDAWGINAAGTVVGYTRKFEAGLVSDRAVRWDASGTATELGDLGDGGSTYARLINDAGTIAGAVPTPDGLRGVRWDASGTAPTELDNLGTSWLGYTNTNPVDINASGVIVGYATEWDDSGQTNLGGRPVVWGLDGVAIKLSTLIDPASGWGELSSIYDISDLNWVTGIGAFDPDGPGGQAPYDRMFLMQVPEPGALPLLGLTVLAVLRRRVGQCRTNAVVCLAGAAAIVCSSGIPAPGAINYTDDNKRTLLARGVTDDTPLDFDNDGTWNFWFEYAASGGAGGPGPTRYHHVYISGRWLDLYLGIFDEVLYDHGRFAAALLPAGTIIDVASPSDNLPDLTRGEPPFTGWEVAAVAEGYLGVKFWDNANQLHTGWLYLRVFEENDAYTVQLLEHAYETVPGAPIIAGAVPEPSTTVLIGVSGLTLLGRRRRLSEPPADPIHH